MTSATDATEKSPHPLASSSVLDTEGRAVTLGELFGARPLVVVFLRHFGCLFTKQQIDEVVRRYDELRAAGADIAVIGNGSVEEARAFASEHALPFALFTDPTRESYCAVGLKHGLGTTLTPGVFARALRARWSGFRQTKTAGDPLQQGGALVFAPDGTELYRHVSSAAGDHPNFDVILRLIARGAC